LAGRENTAAAAACGAYISFPLDEKKIIFLWMEEGYVT
jgi:hypothetical protein